MATPAQCIANVANAQHSTGPKTEEGKSRSARNGIKHGLFATYERLAPAECARVNEFIEELHDGFTEQCTSFEDIIRQYAIAKWRGELFYCMEASFYESAVADERMKDPEASQDLLLGGALRRDAEGPNLFSKLMRYESRVSKELRLARDAYFNLIQIIADNKAKPISSPKSAAPPSVAPLGNAQTPRNAPCPCGSGQKFKRCCGEGAPAVLCAA